MQHSVLMTEARISRSSRSFQERMILRIPPITDSRLGDKVLFGIVSDNGDLDADVPDEVKAIIEEVFSSYSYLLGPVEE